MELVFRVSGERTETLAASLARAQVPPSRFHAIRETPFFNAVRKTFEIGADAKADYLVALDADILLFPDAIEYMLFEARKRDSKRFFRIDFAVYDKFRGRMTGVHFYNNRFSADFRDFLSRRPESADVLRKEYDNVNAFCEEGNLQYRDIPHFIVGKHDYFQYFSKIVRTAQSRYFRCLRDRNLEVIRGFLERKTLECPDDADYSAALEGIRHPEDEQACERFLQKNGLEEKPPLCPERVLQVRSILKANRIMRKIVRHAPSFFPSRAPEVKKISNSRPGSGKPVVGFYTCDMTLSGGNKRILYLAGALKRLGARAEILVPGLDGAPVPGNGASFRTHRGARRNRYDLLIAMNPLFTSQKTFQSIPARYRSVYILHLEDERYTPAYREWIDHYQGDANFLVFGNNPACPKVYHLENSKRYFDLTGGYEPFSSNGTRRRRRRAECRILWNASPVRWKGGGEVLEVLERLRLPNAAYSVFSTHPVKWNASIPVRIHSGVPFERMREVYAEADLFVHFEDRNAGWGNTAFEAIACGVPTICTNFGTVAFAKHRENAWVIPRERNALESALKNLGRNPEKRRNLVLPARERRKLAERFAYRALAGKIMEILENHAA
jgi:glycosyltransferase involved in cell wall biosynthesis